MTEETAKKAKKKGRPQIEIDWNFVDNMAAIHCTVVEIASVLGISNDTLERRCKKDHKMLLAEYMKQKRSKGNVSLRRKQWKLAEAGDKTMMIWLGKQWLGQTDKVEQELHHHNLHEAIAEALDEDE